MTKHLDPYQVTVGGLYLSDLWFNFSHEHWDQLFTKKTKSKGMDLQSDEVWEAVAKDADEFIECLGPNLPNRAEFKQALIEDFLARV